MAEYDALDRMSRTLRGSNPLPPRSPMGAMANDLGRPTQAPPAPEPPRPAGPGNPNVPPGGSAEARAFQQAREAQQAQAFQQARVVPPGAAPTTAPGAAPAAAAPSAASKWFGSADDWKNALKGPADSPHKSLRMTAPEAPGKFAKGVGVLQGAMGAKNAYDGIQEGDTWKAGVGAADAVAGAALLTPAAPAAATYLGLRGAWDGAKMAGAAISDRLSEGTRDHIGGFVNQIALNTGLGGVDDSMKMQVDAEHRLRSPAQSSPAAAPSARPDPKNPYADANAAKIAALDAQNKAAAAPGGYDPNQSRPDLGYGPIGDRTTLTNEQVATMNPQGRVTATGRAADGRPNSFSGVNVSGEVSYIGADGKALAGGGLRGKGFSNFDVAPAGANVVTGPNGSYAFATSGVRSQEQVQADIAQGKQQVADQAQQLGVSVAGMTPAQALKYMQEVR